MIIPSQRVARRPGHELDEVERGPLPPRLFVRVVEDSCHVEILHLESRLLTDLPAESVVRRLPFLEHPARRDPDILPSAVRVMLHEGDLPSFIEHEAARDPRGDPPIVPDLPRLDGEGSPDNWGSPELRDQVREDVLARA